MNRTSSVAAWTTPFGCPSVLEQGPALASQCAIASDRARGTRSRGGNDAYRGRHTKGHDVVRIHTGDSVAFAVRKLAEHRIGVLVVENPWMTLVGLFSERNIVNAVARDGAAVLGYEVGQLMSSPIISCRSSDRIDAALVAMTMGRIRHLPVIDNDVLKGIVSIGDLVKHRLDEKELEANVLLGLSRMRA